MLSTTPIFSVTSMDDDHPLADLALVSRLVADTVEAALVRGGIAPPEAQDLATLAGRVSTLETLPIVALHQTAQQTLPVGWSTMLWQAEDYDPDDLHSPTTNPSRVTIKRKGLYRLAGHVPAVTGSSGLLWARWLKNGTAIPYAAQTKVVSGGNGNGEAAPVASPLVTLLPNDYVELSVAMTGGTGTWSTFIQAGQADGLGPELTVECLRLLP